MFCTGAYAAVSTPAIEFSQDIRPLLANNCLKCHGVDDKGRKGNLRLDVRESAVGAAKSGDHAIVPGKPDQSALIRRIFSNDPDEQMPPPVSKIILGEEQKKLLRRWISDGAEYKPHWAFIPPRQVPLAAVKQADWCRNAIDRFVLASLEKEGLHPSPEANRLTLARRVYLDLIGLPPTPEEADAFATDKSPQAYEKMVELLLASPHYGERWARRWLDLARYSDTNGYEKDRQRSIWPYRDWVINALNADMPFDEFTIEQLAGDMLANATPEQKIATGFHRNTMLNEEGGIDPLEYRFLSSVDRVSTTGTTWLGLTVGCAQCHTHKYDPITNKEYYQFMAFLDNADEPEMEIPRTDMAARRRELEDKIAKLMAELPTRFPASGNVKWEIPAATVATTSGGTAEHAPDGSWKFVGPTPERDTYTFDLEATGGMVDRIRLETVRDGNTGPGRTPHGNFVLSEISVTAKPVDGLPTPLKLARAEADFSQRDYPVEHAIDGDLKTGWAIDDGPGGYKNRSATFYFQKPVQLARGARWQVKLEQNYGEQHVIGHLRLSLGSPASDERPPEARQQQSLARALAEWEQQASAKAMKWTVLRPATMKSSKPILTLLDDASVLASGDITKSDTYDLSFHTEMKGITAVRLEALPHDSLPRQGPGMIFYEGPAGDFSLSEITLTADGKEMKFAKATQTYASGGNTAATAIDGNPQTGWMIDGGQGRAHTAFFALVQPTGDVRELNIRLLFERYFAAALGHFRISVTTDPRAANFEAMQPEVEEALATAASQRSNAQRETILRQFLEATPELAAARQEIKSLRDQIPHPPTTLVMAERPPGHERATHVHHRGEFLSIEDRVYSDVPAFLPPLPAGASHNRLTFAKWLVSNDNPLTARVAVNRQWQGFFGRGIVRTTGDFGYQGELPSHPELLDWLAIEFEKQGWSMKKLDRLIVTSATYRQASRVEAESYAADPQNILLARGPRFRADAEVIRDSALCVSGVLSEKIGGPSVFPPQPASVTTEGAYGPMQWNASPGEDRFRRSLYTFSKRTAPFAMYLAFDAPTGDTCTARREVSNSPLQALTVMNDAVFMECAQAMGSQIAALKEPSDAERATAIFRRCLTRPPLPIELVALMDFAKKERTRFAGKEVDAAQIAGSKDGDVVERATWTVVARAILNLDEMMTKD